MSIPKEPRALMINLMYLVLTAMLALNVSAEIINAFFALEKGIKNTGQVVTKNNEATMEALKQSIKANPKFESWGPKAQKAQEIIAGFEAYINGISADLTTAAGGPHPDHPDRPKNYKDKDVTTNMFVTQGKGKEIEDKITETRTALLALVDKADQDKIQTQLPLMVDSIAHDSPAKSWAEYKFNQMPVAAVMPMLAKFNSDAKTSASTILNYCLDKASGKLEIKLDKYIVAIAPKKAYLISGRDKFEADVTMGAYSSTNNNISISAGGQSLKVNGGVGHYSGGVESGTGERTFNASASIKNPATGETQTVKGEFKYEVGQASVAVAADKMNVFYIGVDNPISIAAAGVSSNALRVNVSGGGASSTGSGKSYTVRVTQPGDVTVTVSAGSEMTPANFKFRSKRIPDPVAKLGGRNTGGAMGNGEFKGQAGLLAMLDNFDFDAKCEIQGFKLTRVAKRADPVTFPNGGGRFGGEVSNLINAAKPGDTYYFDEVKARCPGDQAGRPINPLVFTIK